MMFVNSMGKLMEDDVITELWRKSHELDIETDIIPMAAATPSRPLMTK